MKLYVARDEGSPFCKISISEPHKVYDQFTKKYCWQAGMWDTMVLNPSDFPELTFEDSPMEVRLMREDVVNANYQSIADYEDFLGLVSFMRKAQREANDMIAQVECYQEAQDCIKKAEELELMVDKFIEERT